jgi:hypothetical protein
MDSSWLDRYVDAWVLHAVAGSANGTGELATLLGLVSPDIRYEDVPTGALFTGHNGLTDMCRAAHGWAADLAFTVLTRQTDGHLFALETETAGTSSSADGEAPDGGRTFLLRGVSVGRAGSDGLVSEHRDYWDLGSFLAQVGASTAG